MKSQDAHQGPVVELSEQGHLGTRSSSGGVGHDGQQSSATQATSDCPAVMCLKLSLPC